MGVVAPIADPDGSGPLSGTVAGLFVAGADPSSTTDPLDADSDDDGIADGAEDANRNGIAGVPGLQPCDAAAKLRDLVTRGVGHESLQAMARTIGASLESTTQPTSPLH